ncbi:MAG: hypothetical protein Q9211_006437, partial [Gyalolechia sp. 1 TL-2023]
RMEELGVLLPDLHSKWTEAGVYIVFEDMLCNRGARQPQDDWPAALLIKHPGGSWVEAHPLCLLRRLFVQQNSSKHIRAFGEAGNRKVRRRNIHYLDL